MVDVEDGRQLEMLYSKVVWLCIKDHGRQATFKTLPSLLLGSRFFSCLP